MEREGRHLEYKLHPTKSYLKTVSAFANYGTGRIIFGVSDDRQNVGIENPEETALNLENQINDNVSPSPDYTISIDAQNLITVTVRKGRNTPYCYKGTAYKRNDSSTVAVSDYEYRNLVMQGSNLTFSEIPFSGDDHLTFSSFSKAFERRLGIQPVFPDTFITLELYTKDSGFTNAAGLLSDENPFPGIDIVRYGESRAQILERVTLEKMSVLEMLEQAEMIFRRVYTYETVEGFTRVLKERIPISCFRELIANGLIHREWLINSRIKVEMYPDRLYVLSPGGLPEGLSRDEYLSDRHLSILRNRSLSLIFLKLGKIESLGTGIPMIRETYASSVPQPVFDVSESSVTTMLPAVDSAADLTEEQKTLFRLIRDLQPVSSKTLLENSGFTRSTQTRLLNGLIEKQIIIRNGSGPATRYSLKK